MYGTVFSVLVSLFFFYSAFEKGAPADGTWMGIALIIMAGVIALIQSLAYIMAWSPLQKAEKNFTPRIVQAFQSDQLLKWGNIGLLLFLLLTFVIATDFLYFNLFNKTLLLAIWIIFFGIGIDQLSLFMQRVLVYLNPFAVIDRFLKEAVKSIGEEDEVELCQWIDALSEIAIKATHRSSTSLANHAISQMPPIVDTYFKASKSIGHQKLDKALYTLYYLLKRMALVNHKAIEQRVEPVTRHVVNTASKIAVSAAEFDITTTDHPIRFIGDAALDAQKGGMEEIADYASCALLEVAKKILTEVDVTYLEIKDTFFTLINQLEQISKETFRRDKNINLKILHQPFADLKALFETEKMAKHQDTPVIVQDINRITGEFDALGMVMRTIPPIPKEDSSQPAAGK